jgi:hypothetical protein
MAPPDASPKDGRCRWVSFAEALRQFAFGAGSVQGQEHIKPLHWYVACRLVLEGGFRPSDIIPHPPFRMEPVGRDWRLHFDPSAAGGGERTIFGGLKTKDVDVVVAKDGLGPVLAVSCKGITKSLRNLTNRLEEAVGDCTNLHITYPALVIGYMFLMRANRSAEIESQMASIADKKKRAQLRNDIVVKEDGNVAEAAAKFAWGIGNLGGRRGIRNDVSRYEAVAFGLVDTIDAKRGVLLDAFPSADSNVRYDRFFETLYRRYDERFVYGAPDLARETKRISWLADSAPVFNPTMDDHSSLDYELRLSDTSES